MRFIFITGIVVCALILGCSSKEIEDTKPVVTPYDDWSHYTYGNVQIIFPEKHPLEYSFADVTKGYQAMRRRICGFLRMEEPKDTLRIYYYSGFGQGREMTGHEYPFVTEDAIHYWIPSYYGPTLVQYLLNRWQPGPVRHQFLRHGLITLLDFSGQNYHKSTLDYIKDEKFIPLSELAVDTLIDSNKERFQSAEAASFVDYLVFRNGIDKFRVLYRSTAPFDSAVKEIYGLSVDSMQTLWLEMARYAITLDTTISQ